MNIKRFVSMLKEAFADFLDDKAPRLGASLSFYTVFSIAPLLLIAIAMAGLIFGEEAARGEIVGTIGGLVGEKGAKAIEDMVENASKERQGVLATIIGFVTLLFGASGVFGQLKDALNTIWEVEPKKGGGIGGFIRERFLSFTMVLGVGFLLLVSLVMSAALGAMGSFLSANLPGGEALWNIVNLVVSFGVITFLFAVMFKYLPDIKIEWRDVWIGATFTSALFVLGKFAIGLYLGKSSAASVFGAAGSLVVILVWIYYSAQILFFGAEFTQVYANSHGSRRNSPTPLSLRREIHAGMRQGAMSSNAGVASPSRKGAAGKVVAGVALGGCLGIFAGAGAALIGLVKVVKKLVIWK